AGGALVSLAALKAALNAVDIASVIGRSGRPMMLFKAHDDNGTWSFGQQRTIPEPDCRWAINPTSIQWGYISFDGNKRLGERLVSVFQPKPDPTQLPDTGFPWQEEWAVDLKCIDGADAGVEVIFKTATDGGNQAVAGLLDEIRNRVNSNQHG